MVSIVVKTIIFGCFFYKIFLKLQSLLSINRTTEDNIIKNAILFLTFNVFSLIDSYEIGQLIFSCRKLSTSLNIQVTGPWQQNSIDIFLA